MTITRKAFLLLAAAGKRLAGAASPVRWGMAVDVAKCARLNGCTKCIDACHQAHNVPVLPEPRHRVRWLWKESFARVFRSQEAQYVPIAATPVMVLCNHCDNPPCVRVCPAQATWKRGDGIVAMDWHRCIGCRYCMAACPYGARSFNFVEPRPYLRQQNAVYPARSKGVVEKCTFCSERLAEGRPPACVETCPEKALTFGNLADPNSELRRALGARYYVRRKPELGTSPDVFYIV
jgi:molybdopterin-containing oxidoreductase family iron-sulfur binding subunit